MPDEDRLDDITRAAWFAAVLLPIAGFAAGFYLLAKNRPAGIAVMLLSAAVTAAWILLVG